ncbi:MAG: methyltransferase [Promethearchaeota archaeon]
MTNALFTTKTLKKIKRIFPIHPTDKIFLPIISNVQNLEKFLSFFPNRIYVSVPSFRIHSNILDNQIILSKISEGNIQINVDFFGLTSKSSDESITKILVFFPNSLSLSLVDYALHQLSILLNRPTDLLLIVNNRKQYDVILKWAEKNKIDYFLAKYQNWFFLIVHQLNPSNIRNSDFKDHIFKINYVKEYGEFEFFSSDGVFSKEKIDAGTDFLIDTILHRNDLKLQQAEVIDYFSGMGVIGIILAKIFGLEKIHFVESDLISLFLLKRNIDIHQITNSVVHEMDGLKKSTITPNSVDLIVANPPTHIKKEEFKTFLQLTNLLLKKEGKLMIVINNIIPYEYTLRKYFPDPSNINVFQKDNYKVLIS